VLALKAAGYTQHSRTREAVSLLVDRLLPDGGCNYGNTMVLGQQLRPHLQPTGLTLAALAGEPLKDPRLDASLEYLRRALSQDTPCLSLCYGLWGLAAHRRFPPQADHWLSAAAERLTDCKSGLWKLSLVVLAALGERNPLLPSASPITSG
jgi:hypothetical protein